jgi:hypothetical protein
MNYKIKTIFLLMVIWKLQQIFDGLRGGKSSYPSHSQLICWAAE